MGSGTWDNTSYTTRAANKKASGQQTFQHTANITSGKSAAAASALLDLLQKAGPDSPFAGKVMRECAISDEHPNPTPIAIILDVTASNRDAAIATHAKLPQLFGLLQRKSYVQDPQVLIGAVGDAHSDRVPLQIGQFESDNRIDLQLEEMYLEMGGGGQTYETYELGAYFLARHSHLESFHEQGRKGYAIFIGDEKPYDKVKRSYSDGYYGQSHTLESLTGDVLEADVPTKQIFEELQEQYEVFFLFQRKSGMYTAAQTLPPWQELLHENALVLEDPSNVCEFIAGLLAMREGGLDLDQVGKDLADSGFDAGAIQSVSKTLATVGAGSGSGSGGTVAKTEGGVLDLPDSGGGVDRL